MKFLCPYLRGEIELTEERLIHIAKRHPDLIPSYQWCLAETLADPDAIRRSKRFGNARMFYRRFPQVKDGKYIIVAVVSDNGRHWIITAYISRSVPGGDLEWVKN